MSEFWFKPKRYGYGATPVTWQGWVFTVTVALIVVVASMLPYAIGAENPAAWVAAIGVGVIALVVLWVISRRKTDGEWRWRWGG
jgi:multisubunit Na+/H+ antiporter MnhB subunit